MNDHTPKTVQELITSSQTQCHMTDFITHERKDAVNFYLYYRKSIMTKSTLDLSHWMKKLEKYLQQLSYKFTASIL